MAQDQKSKLDTPSAEPTLARKDAASSALASAAPAAPAASLPERTTDTAAGRPSPMPPPLPNASAPSARGDTRKTEAAAEEPREAPQRRVARRRPAGPVRGRIAANDDAPSIGGLIYALEQKPSNKPFVYAGYASAVWGLIGSAFLWAALTSEAATGSTLAQILAKPVIFLTAAAVIVPIGVIWFLALLAWRAEELRLRSSTMTEVAIRLAEPDRMAEQSVASLGQAIRRQVSFMNDAVSRALGRAGELEALVHNEVAALERSYEDNERKIRSLIDELSGERHALLNTSERVTDTLRTLGTEVPTLIEKLSTQQVKLAQIIEGAGQNLSQLESSLGQGVSRLEDSLTGRAEQLRAVLSDYTEALDATLGARTGEIQGVLEGYTGALATALSNRSDQMQEAFAEYMRTLDVALANRTDNLQTVFEEYARALDTTLANRAQALDVQLVERTRSLDAAFEERLRLFDESILRSAAAIDSAVSDKAQALTSALETHARTFKETIGRQSQEIDESLMHGINAVRRSSENITRQSLKAIEGLASQSELLKSVSENLLNQIATVTSRFESQGQSIMRAANALETANYKIDLTLQARHAELNQTLDRLSGKADEFGRFIEGYSNSIEGTLTEAEIRARAVAEELKAGTEIRQREAIADLERMKEVADAESERALEELKRRFAAVSNEVSAQLGTLSSRFDETSEEVRQRAARAAAEIAAEQARLREQLDRLPATTRESTEAMCRALQDQLKALEQLSSLTGRQAAYRDVAPPLPSVTLSGAYATEAGIGESGGRSWSTLSTTIAQELTARGRPTESAPRHDPLPPLAPGVSPVPTSKSGDPRSRWSLGDLLARASRDEDGAHGAPPGPPFALDLEVIARALDPTTAAAIWARLRSGQRGIMVRSIYSIEGRAAFDEVCQRHRIDPEFQATVTRYLAEFERIVQDAEQKDPSGQLAQSHRVSDIGRVYLFLAHATGRL